MSADDTTDKMFPPPENPNPPEPSIPLQPSIRSAFIAHHSAILQHFGDFRAEMLELVRAEMRRANSAPPPAASIGATIKNGALTGLRYGGVCLAAGELAAEVLNALGRPDIEGPLRVILQMLGGS